MIARLNSAGLKLEKEYSRSDTAKILRVRRNNMQMIVASSTLAPNDKDMFRARDISLFIDEFMKTDIPPYPGPDPAA